MDKWIISKKSHSYRFLTRYKADIPWGFCAYYRKVLKGMFLFTLFGVCLASFLLTAVSWLLGVSLVFGPDGSLLSRQAASFDYASVTLVMLTLATIFGGVVTCIITFFGILLGTIKVCELTYNTYHKVFPVKSSTTKKNPGVIKTWYRAYKDKMCPLIEFKD